MREIVQLNIGETGINLGAQLWDRLAEENGVLDGHKDLSNQIFSEGSNGNFTPRTLFIDTDYSANDVIKKSKLGQHFFDHEQFINLKEDTANIQSRGKYTLGRSLKELVIDKIRLQLENCDSPQGILINHSIIGGTGSGFTSNLLQE